VNATANFAGFSPFGVAQCGIRTASAALSREAQATVGSAEQLTFGAIAVTAAFTLAAPEEVLFACHGGPSVTTQGGMMTAIQVQTLTDLTQ